MAASNSPRGWHAGSAPRTPVALSAMYFAKILTPRTRSCVQSDLQSRVRRHEEMHENQIATRLPPHPLLWPALYLRNQCAPSRWPH
eukprot:1403239-Rhodomonas_salina.1